jgi:hypothetical protein
VKALGSWGDMAGAIATILALAFVFWKGARWAVHTSDTLRKIGENAEQINKAVNHQPAGTPPLAEQVTKIADGLERVADEADRKHQENKDAMAALEERTEAALSRLTRQQALGNTRLDKIGRSLGMDDVPWDPSQGDRRKGGA